MPWTIRHDIAKALVSVVIEQSLVEAGPAVLDTVSQRIYEKRQCCIPECYENPEYLSEALGSISGAVHFRIGKRIKDQLEEFSYQENVQKFIQRFDTGLAVYSETLAQ